MTSEADVREIGYPSFVNIIYKKDIKPHIELVSEHFPTTSRNYDSRRRLGCSIPILGFWDQRDPELKF